MLLAFAREILRWLPEDRLSARELMEKDNEFLYQWSTSPADDA